MLGGQIDRGAAIAALALLAIGGAESFVVIALVALLGAAIPLGHVMFGLPPTMQCEPPAVAAPRRLG